MTMRAVKEMTMDITRFISTAVLAILLVPAVASAQEEVVYYHTDAIGSVRAITDATGTVIGRYDYLPFGELWPTTPPSPVDPRQFAGKERDAESGLDYFGARYYRPQSGRFTTTDPALNIESAISDPQRWSRYPYARNNPLVFVDPDGREIWLSASHQRAVAAAGRRAAPVAAVGLAAAGIGAMIKAGPIAWRAAYGCYLSVVCQSRVLDIGEALAGAAPSSAPFSPSAAARNFGFVGEMAEAGSLFSGQLANGATVAANFTKVGDTLAVNISLLAGPSGTIALVEQGIRNAAKATNATNIKIVGTAVSDAMARFLRMQGFVEKEGVWMKEILR